MSLSPPPIKDGNFPYVWQDWFRQVRDSIQGIAGSIPWSSVSKSGSNLTDLVTRNHDNLQNISGSGTAHVPNYTEGTWTPTFTSLTVVNGTGGATYAGRYTQIGRMLYFTVKISCTGTATTASTAGTTYCDLPVLAAQDDGSSTVNATTKLNIGGGYVDSTNDRNYPAGWAATGNTIILTGQYEV